VILFLVSVVGLYLFWQYRQRTVQSSVKDKSDVPGESFTSTCTESPVYGVLLSAENQTRKKLYSSEEQSNSSAYGLLRATEVRQFTTVTSIVEDDHTHVQATTDPGSQSPDTTTN
jgi:hypothetical protein